MSELKRVAITGASSGIGAALARRLAAAGASLALLARRKEKLDALVVELTQTYPQQQFVALVLDVTELDTITPCLQQASDALGGLDTLVANAGVALVNACGKGDFMRDKALIDTNLIAAMACCDAAASRFRQQGYGHIVGISSIAAIQGIPGSAAYSASKAGFGHYLTTIGMELANKGIAVTAIYPGFINTELAPNMEKMPFVISADKAAEAMLKAMRRKKRRLIVPFWPWRLLLPLLKLLPPALITKAVR